LGGKHLEERTGGALDWCIVAPIPRAADHTRALPFAPCLSTPTVPTARLFRYGTTCGGLASKYRQASTRTASSPFNQCSLPRPSTRDVPHFQTPHARWAMHGGSGALRPPSTLPQPVPFSIFLAYPHTARGRQRTTHNRPPHHRSASCAGDLAFSPATSPCSLRQRTRWRAP
jgi:hypothetical protein